MKKTFLNKISGITASIITMSLTAQAHAGEALAVNNTSLLLPETSSEERPILFLDSASNEVADYLVAGHRSHSSHRSHYSSRGGASSYTSKQYYGTEPSPAASRKNNTSSTTTTTSSAASDSKLVQKIQINLVKLGYTLSVNGVYDTSTKKAIAMFQADHDVTIDGQASQNLLDKINEEIKKR